ncbi:chemotaxis protein CheB [Saccharicrinis fermentans]|uniref:protein-glutamate methylesterase n=1 Tax=Saccharicrinis fermentans DSM 9555 = JCM 21142 TaxID=869213 RepID=W7YGV6_9BACT|nr:chemotaxis protein CheB [Saccharicrinis fermentans]GAF01839.1 chemotaxis response regulator protein-glutamate methylesterase [Saccharicrinis fermentans DSM 9555 = JCM 21142]
MVLARERYYKGIVIGGSAGSFSIVSKILSHINADFKYPIIICMHRLKHIRSGLLEGLNLKSNLPVVEPCDKDKIEGGKVYLAPSNYHMFIEFDATFSLTTENVFNHSRPSIDYTLSSAANAFRDKMVGIILTGANKDGAKGMRDVNLKKGYTIVQDPVTCDVDTMTKSTLQLFEPNEVLSPDGIIRFLNSLH